jgi:hypothetical protein
MPAAMAPPSPASAGSEAAVNAARVTPTVRTFLTVRITGMFSSTAVAERFGMKR